MLPNINDIDDDSPLILNFVKAGDVFIGGDFDETMGISLIPDFLMLIKNKISEKAHNPDANLKISCYINSNGGDILYLKQIMGLFDLAKDSGIIMETIVWGGAYSCGSMLACYGTKEYRLSGRNAEHLIHFGSTSGEANTPNESERISRYNKEHFDFISEHYKKNAKIPNLKKKLESDFYVFGQDILNFGLSDKII